MNKKNIIIWILTFVLLCSFASALDYTTGNTLWVTLNNAVELTALEDLSPSGYDLTNNGATNDFADNAFSFDGTDDYMVGTNPVVTETFSISIWFKSSETVSEQYIFNARETGSDGYWLRAEPASNRLRLLLYDGSTAEVVMVAACTDACADGNWHHIMGTLSSGDSDIYLDGTHLISYADTWTETVSTQSLFIASDPATNSEYAGSLSQVLTWDTIIGESDVAALYALGRTYNGYNVFTVTVNDVWDNSAINNATLNITLPNGTSQIFTNETGNVIMTTILTNTSDLLNITLTQSTYFTNTTNNINASTLSTMSMAQSNIMFNVSNLFNNSVNGNITINGETNNLAFTWLLSGGLYNATFSSSSYFNLTQEINVSALDNLTINFTGVYGSQLNITAIESLFGNVVENFTINIINSENGFNVTQTSVGPDNIFNLVKDVEYNITFSKPIYLDANVTLLVNLSQQNYQFVVFALNNILINFFDEITLEPQLNVSFDLLSNIFSGSFSTTTGSFSLDSIPNAIYEIRYGLNSTILAPRSYYFIVPLNSSADANLSFFTIDENISFQFIRNIVDQNSFPLEGSILEIQRPYPSTDNTSLIYRTVERALIDSTGDAVFTAVPNTQAYRFRVLQNFSIARIFTPTFLVETTKQLTVEDAPPVGQSFNELLGISSVLSFNSTTSYYILDYNDANSVSSEVCLTVYRTVGITTTDSEQCSSLDTATLLVFVNQSLNGSARGVSTASISDDLFTLNSEVQVFGPLTNASSIFQGVALIIYILLLIFAGTMTAYTNMVYPIAFTFAATIAFSFTFLGMIALSATLMGGVMVLGISILVVAKK